MKKYNIPALLTALFTAALLCACSAPNQPVPGTEQTYTGVITDRYMAQTAENAFRDTSRSYLLLRLDDGSEVGVWDNADGSAIPDGASIGTYVELESAVEENTDLRICTGLTVLKRNLATLEKYQDILEGIYYDHILPDGQPVEPQADADPEHPNQFAVYDVDGDGVDELLIRYINSYMAGQFGVVYGYDELTGKLHQQLLEFPALTFYQNGVVEAAWSHNQGLAGRFWPCTLYRYDPVSDTYPEYASIDAWDRKFFETDWDGRPFPAEADPDGEGIVYYVRPADAEGSISPISQREFDLWYNDTTGFDPKIHIPSDFPVHIPYQALSEENIAAIA